jgi:hypothetical protein
MASTVARRKTDGEVEAMRIGVRCGRWRLAVGALMAAGVMLTACSAPGADDNGAGGAPELDLASLEAEIDAGTLQAQPVPNSFVGAVTDDLFVAVALDDSGGGGQVATVYVCDGAGVSTWLRGAVAADEPTRLGGFEDGASVEFVVAGDAVHGHVVTAQHGGPQYFEAVPASGEAGLYRAEDTLEGDDYVGGWIVLDDGRQQGGADICYVVCTTIGGVEICYRQCIWLF